MKSDASHSLPLSLSKMTKQQQRQDTNEHKCIKQQLSLAHPKLLFSSLSLYLSLLLSSLSLTLVFRERTQCKTTDKNVYTGFVESVTVQYIFPLVCSLFFLFDCSTYSASMHSSPHLTFFLILQSFSILFLYLVPVLFSRIK